MAPVGRTTIPARGRRKTGVWKGHPLTAAFARCLIMSVTHRVTAPLFDTASDFAFGNNLQTFIYDTFLEPTVPQAKRKGYKKPDKKRAFRRFVWAILARNRIVKLSWNSAGR